MRQLRISAKEARGFTLIELMIVVVIVGVLSAIAFYNVSQYVRESKTAEASAIIGNIMGAQEEYQADTDSYLDVTGGLSSGATDYYPSDATFNGTNKIMWGAADACSDGTNTCLDNWKRLGVIVNAPVLFRYACTTFAATANLSSVTAQAPGYNPSNMAAPSDGYVVVAKSDLNGDGGRATVIVASSWTADFFSYDLGE